MMHGPINIRIELFTLRTERAHNTLCAERRRALSLAVHTVTAVFSRAKYHVKSSDSGPSHGSGLKSSS